MKKHFNKLFWLMTVVVMAMVCFAFLASAFTYGDYEYELLDDGTVEITDYTGSATKLDVPSELDGKRVSSIGDGAFDDCPVLNEIYLPDSLEHMGDTFYGCSGLVVYYMGDIYQWMNVEGWENVSDYFNVVTQPHICTEIVIKGKAATCTEKGLSDGKLCTACSVITKKQTDIPATGHKLTTLKAVTPTCTKEGKTEGKKCSTCGKVTVAQKTIAKKAHTYKTTTTKATLTKNGKTVKKCTACGYVSKTTTVYYPKTIKLSYTTTTYNGKVKKPTVTVKDSKGNTLKKDTDYTVKYASGRKNPGKYTVTVTFKGKYSGTKKLTLTIKPKAPSITSIYSKTKGKAVVKWANVTGESGFQLYYSTSKNGTYKKVKSYAVNKLAGSKTKLKSGKKYYFKIRAYKKTSSGTVYSSWSSIKSVKIK